MSTVACFVDNEGCLTPGKGIEYDLAGLKALRLHLLAHPRLPLVIATGRSAPYCEALVQAVGIQQSEVPILCEGGGVLYHPKADRCELLCPQLRGDDIVDRLGTSSFRIEPGKLTCVSLYPEEGATVISLLAIARTKLDGLGIFNVTASSAAVDITYAGIDKRFGVQAIASRYGIDLARSMACGDQKNDIPMLQCVGFPTAPKNCAEEVAQIVRQRRGFVSEQNHVHGVLDARESWRSWLNATGNALQ